MNEINVLVIVIIIIIIIIVIIIIIIIIINIDSGTICKYSGSSPYLNKGIKAVKIVYKIYVINIRVL